MIKPATVIPHKKAKKLAKQYRPIFVQYYKDFRDMITPVYFGKLMVNLDPVIYFSAKSDTDHTYILYCVFHRKDWSSRGGLIGHLDSHEYDLEGVIVVVDGLSEKVVATASIFHSQIKFSTNQTLYAGRPVFLIQSEGHGIYMEESIMPRNHLTYMDYGLVNINEPRVHKKFFGIWKKEFNKNGVSTPDQWGYVSKMGVKSKGLIYTDPRKLFNIARKRKLLT